MTNHMYFKPRTDKPKVVITDYDYGNINVESEILEAVGAEVIALQAKSEEDLFGVAPILCRDDYSICQNRAQKQSLSWSDVK